MQVWSATDKLRSATDKLRDEDFDLVHICFGV